MTNEELATAIQSGERDKIGILWEQVRHLVWMLARRYDPGAGIVEMDDLLQAGFIAVWEAVQDFKPDQPYKFTSYLKRHIQTQAAALVGYRTAKQKRERQQGPPVSLNMSIGEEEDCELVELLEDPQAAQAFEDTEHQIWRQELRETLDQCLDSIPAEHAAAIRGRYFEGRTLSDMASEQHRSSEVIRQRENKGMRALRRGQCLQRLRPFVMDVIDAYGYRSSLRTFRNQQASSTEIAVEKLDRYENK